MCLMQFSVGVFESNSTKNSSFKRNNVETWQKTAFSMIVRNHVVDTINQLKPRLNQNIYGLKYSEKNILILTFLAVSC